MENAQKAIMVGVGLFITIIIISAVMLISSAGQDVIDNSMDEINDISSSLSRQLYSDFAGATLSGREVIAAIKRYAGTEGLEVKLWNGSEATSVYYTPSNMGRVDSDIVPTGTYESGVLVENNIVKRITFKRI